MDATHRAGIIVAIVMSVHGAAEARPAWCEQDLHKASTWEDRALGADPREALLSLVGVSCMNERNVKASQADLAAARARWNKELGMTDADWATDVVPWAIGEPAFQNDPSPKWDIKQAPTTLDALQQYGFIKPTNFGSNNDPLYALDRLGPKLTMTGRLAYLERCLYVSKPVEWVLCQPDLDAFDPKQVYAEMHADKSERGFDRMALRLNAYMLKGKLAKRAEQIKELVATDAAWAQLFALSADAHKEWAASPPDASILAVASAMDDASITNSSKALAGCEDTTWTAFSTAIAAIPAAKFKETKKDYSYFSGIVGVVVNDKNAYLASTALVSCHKGKSDVLDRFLGSAMVRWPGFRGPRSFALTKLMASGIALDDRSARIEYPQVNRRFEGGNNTGGGGVGAVAKVKANGAKTHVEFVKKLQKVKVCTAWKDTGRIEQILSNGSVIYESNCTKYGFDTIDNASPPTDVDTKYADGLKAGTFARIVENVVVSVAPKGDGPPTRIFGIAVK